MIQIQYDLFDDLTELNLMKKEISSINEKCDNVRRGIFSRLNDMQKIVLKLTNDNQELNNRVNSLEKLMKDYHGVTNKI